MNREQLAEDIRYNESQAAQYRNNATSRMNEILRDYYEAEVARLKARLAEWQKEAIVKWD